MLALPLIPPQQELLSTTFRPLPDSDTPHNNNQNPHQQNRQLQQRRDEERKAHNARSPLALLAADEAAIAQRKAAIRSFGAYWIRPPGISKTLQAMNEEEAERVEQEELARQERGLLDMQAQQQLEEVREQAGEAAADADEAAEAGEERNLDDEIPEAEATADLSFNEDSMVEGSSQLVEQVDEEDGEQYAEMEEAELTGAARDEEELGIEHERNLDDSVPEAGSYQHTDTEAEDSSSESGLQDSFAVQSTRRSARVAQAQPLQVQPQGPGGFQGWMRAAETLSRSPGNLNLSSSLLESSFVGSSPVVQRGSGGQGRGGRRRGRQS